MIADAMVRKFDELGDVKFIINVGDSFYPSGVFSKHDTQWDTKWRHIYPAKLRSVPWYSVYGNHDYRGDSCACSNNLGACNQINGDENNLDYFYMPAPNWFKRHPELDLEVVGMDLNQFVGSKTVQGSTAPLDCWHTRCAHHCSQHLYNRAQEAFHMLHERMEKSTARNMIVFSHYPTDYLVAEPKFLVALSNASRHHVEYFGGHRHDVDQESTHTIAPNNNWLVGGGGGWGCDGSKQGFVVGEISHDSRLTTYSVLVDSAKCCAAQP